MKTNTNTVRVAGKTFQSIGDAARYFGVDNHTFLQHAGVALQPAVPAPVKVAGKTFPSIGDAARYFNFTLPA